MSTGGIEGFWGRWGSGRGSFGSEYQVDLDGVTFFGAWAVKVGGGFGAEQPGGATGCGVYGGEVGVTARQIPSSMNVLGRTTRMWPARTMSPSGTFAFGSLDCPGMVKAPIQHFFAYPAALLRLLSSQSSTRYS